MAHYRLEQVDYDPFGEQPPDPDDPEVQLAHMEHETKKLELTHKQKQFEHETKQRDREDQSNEAEHKHKLDEMAMKALLSGREAEGRMAPHQAVSEIFKATETTTKNMEQMQKLTDNMQKVADSIETSIKELGGIAKQVEKAVSTISEAAERMAAPKKLIRDPKTGRASGVETVWPPKKTPAATAPAPETLQ